MSPQECFDALVDFETYPQWQSAIRTCRVRSRDRDGRARRVCFETDSNAGSMAYTFDYSYESPHLISWGLVDGEAKDADGELVLEDRGDGTTLATYALRIDPGGSTTGAATYTLEQGVMRRSVEDLKSRIEGRG